MKYFVIFGLLVGMAHGTTYYVDNCVVTGNDSNNGTATGTPWLTVSKVNGFTFAAGDSILFQKNCTWREQLNVPRSGSAGNVMTIGAYGVGNLPSLNAANVITGWTKSSTNVWYVNSPMVNVNAVMVIEDGVILLPVASVGAVVAGTYFVDTAPNPGVVYAYLRDDTPSNHTMELSARQYGVFVNAKQYLNIQNLDVRYGSYAGIRLTGTQANGFCTVSGNNAYANRQYGIAVDSGHSQDTVSGNTASYNGNGIYAFTGANSTTISGNTTHHTIKYLVGTLTDGDGVAVYRSNNTLIENNETSYNDEHGISIDLDTANVIDIRYNHTHHNGNVLEGYGINMSGGIGGTSADNRIYYNVAHDNDNSKGFNVDYVLYGPLTAYNNTSYSDGTHSVYNESFVVVSGTVVLKNNIGYITSGSVAQYALHIFAGVTLTSNYNLWLTGGTYTVLNNGTNETFAQWQAHGYDANSINANPRFTNPGADFTLQASSPAIDVGANLGTTYQLGLNPVLYPRTANANQNSFGAGWEMGAYVYTGGAKGLLGDAAPPPPPTGLTAVAH